MMESHCARLDVGEGRGLRVVGRQFQHLIHDGHELRPGDLVVRPEGPVRVAAEITLAAQAGDGAVRPAREPGRRRRPASEQAVAS
jgi:hypothetical protein